MRISIGVQFLFEKVPICKDFPIPFNDNRLYGGSEMISVEPFPFYPSIPFNERLWGVHFLIKYYHKMERIPSFFFAFFLFGKLAWLWITLRRQIAETQGITY